MRSSGEPSSAAPLSLGQDLCAASWIVIDAKLETVAQECQVAFELGR